MFEIGSQWILKGVLNDGTTVYWNKTQEYVKDPLHATFFKNQKQAEKNKKAWDDYWKATNGSNASNLKFEDVNPSVGWEVKEIKLMLVD